jgi:hypothetical protein
MITHKIVLSKFAGLIEEIADKDLSFITEDNYYDYLEACKQLGYEPSRKILDYLEAFEDHGQPQER